MMTRVNFLVVSAKFFALSLVLAIGLLSILATSNSGNITTTVACTGPGQNVRTGSVVILDARCSDVNDAASESALLDYRWRLIDKPPGSNSALLGFTMITRFTPDVDGGYLFELATDTSGASISTTRHLVTAATGNARPRVEAGAYQEVALGDAVTLGASGTDADADALSYSWAFNASSLDENLAGASTAAASFSANQATDYLVEVTASDGAVNSPTDTVLVRSKISNLSLPVAVAGPDQFVIPGSQVLLSGLDSYSAYARPLSYQWRMLSKPDTSNAVLSSESGAQPSFIADQEGDYLIRLRVNDGFNDSSRVIDGVFEDRLVVFARSNRLPVAEGGADREVNTGVTVILNGSASSDPETSGLSYAWSLYRQPATSNAVLASTDSVQTQLTPDVDGDYLVRLVVNDGRDDSLPDIVRVAASSLSAGATPLTIATSLPYAPVAAEVLTRVLIDNDGSDTLALDSADDTVPANFDIALMSNANGTDNANFNAFPGWTVVSPVVLTINEAATPTFILQRSADGVYYQLDLGFTVLDASFTVQIDSLQAWRCGVNPTDCP